MPKPPPDGLGGGNLVVEVEISMVAFKRQSSDLCEGRPQGRGAVPHQRDAASEIAKQVLEAIEEAGSGD
jgi:hypothetical protein